MHRLIRQHNLPAVIVNPSTPIGPRDIKPTPTGRIITDTAKGKMPAYVDTGLNIVHVDDVAMGHWLAYERGKIGERYILGGQNLGFGEILAIIAGTCWPQTAENKTAAPIDFSDSLCRRSLRRALRKREPFVTVDALRMAKKKMFFSSAKAERELGYKSRPAREAIADALNWFKANGYC